MRRAVPLLLLPVLLLAGCSSSGGDGDGDTESFDQPAASSFRDGSCRTAADQILGIGRDARELGTNTSPPAEVRDRLKAAQDVLVATREGLEPDLAPSFSRLIVAIGLVRLRADSNSYAPDLGTDLSAAYDVVVAACTTPATTAP